MVDNAPPVSMADLNSSYNTADCGQLNDDSDTVYTCVGDQSQHCVEAIGLTHFNCSKQAMREQSGLNSLCVGSIQMRILCN